MTNKLMEVLSDLPEYDEKVKIKYTDYSIEATKEMISNMIRSYISEDGNAFREIEKILSLEPNYFNDILTDKREIKPEDAALIYIIYNFPFIIKRIKEIKDI